MTSEARGIDQPPRAVPIRVLAVDDEVGRTASYEKCLQPCPDIAYLGEVSHVEALAGGPKGGSWLDYDVILLDLGVSPYLTDESGRAWANPRRIDDVDMFAGFKVAAHIHALHPQKPRPFIALITQWYRDPGVRERAARLRTFDGFFDRGVYERDEGENLRKLVYAAAEGKVWIEGAAQAPEPSFDEKKELADLLEGRTVTAGDTTDVQKAVEDGAAKMKQLGVTMDDYLYKTTWSQRERRMKIDPITKAIGDHFNVRRRENGEIFGRDMDIRLARKLFKRWYYKAEKKPQ